MGSKRISSFVVAILVLTSNAPHCLPQSRTGLRTWLADSGSVPPIGQWFSCVQELEHRPYDKQKAQVCLDSILSHPEIEKGEFVFDQQKELLTFYIKAPMLILSDMDLDVAANELAKLYGLLPDDALNIGEPYERSRESRIWSALNLLFRSEGRRAGISRTLRLDYAKKTAQVTYKIWEGPPDQPELLPPPYSPPCSITNLNFNYMDMDDRTPIDFVRRQIKIKPMGCFSEADLRDDRTALSRMTFLKESDISVSGSGRSKSFVFHFRSNPILISRVTVHGYGLLSSLSGHDIPSLTVHTGDFYMRSLVGEQERSLRRFFSRDGRQAESFTDVQVGSDGKATLDFGILTYPDNVVYVNDKPYDVTFKRKD
jgi:hypothetical protein